MSLALCEGAWAQSAASAEIAAIRAEIEALSERLQRLEQGAAGNPASVVAAQAAPRPQAAAVRAAEAPAARLSGDLRYRHESINEDLEAERHRHRLRARIGVAAGLGEDLEVGLTLATGNDDPVSANQTLGGGFSRKSVGVDRAFFSWRATDSIRITGGKMANPFVRPGNHHLVYDGDLNPEGLALRFAKGDWFANYAGWWVEERGSADDSIMLGGQVGWRRSRDDGMRVTAGVSYYDYLETEGQAPFFDGAGNGNRVGALGNYLSDFNSVELFAEVGFDVGRRPLNVFADYVTNVEADDADKGYAVGASYGQAARAGDWRVGYAYQDLEADAVIATFTDSDFAGGGTGGRGHVVDFTYTLRDRWQLGLRYFLTKRTADLGGERDYNRLQADLSFSY